LRFWVATILAWALAATAAAETLPLAHDLAADGRDARASGLVIVVLFSTPGCPYCKQVRDAFLRPLLAEEAKRVLVREIDVDGAQPVVDFGGRAATHRELGMARRVRLVPYVVFLGPDGESLAEPLIGISSVDLYGGLLGRRIETARARLGAN
jgi:thioredoxin-related protein